MDRYSMAIKKKAKFKAPDPKDWKNFIMSILTAAETVEIMRSEVRSFDSPHVLDTLNGLRRAKEMVLKKLPDKYNKGLAPTEVLNQAMTFLDEQIKIRAKEEDDKKLLPPNRNGDRYPRDGLGSYVPPGVYTGIVDRVRISDQVETPGPTEPYPYRPDQDPFHTTLRTRMSVRRENDDANTSEQGRIQTPSF